MEPRRVVITGIGAVSPIGLNVKEVNSSLKDGKSGISFNEEYKELGMRSHIAGSIDISLPELIDRKLLRFMGETAAYSFVSAEEAINDANLKKENFNDSTLQLIDSIDFNPKVIKYDRKQPEFKLTFHKYLQRNITPQKKKRDKYNLKGE